MNPVGGLPSAFPGDGDPAPQPFGEAPADGEHPAVRPGTLGREPVERGAVSAVQGVQGLADECVGGVREGRRGRGLSLP